MDMIQTILIDINKKLDKILNIYEGFTTQDIEEEIVFVDNDNKYLCSIDDIPTEIVTLPKFTKYVILHLNDMKIKLNNVKSKNDAIIFLGNMCRE